MPNFSISVSQGIGRPEEREGDGGMVGWWGGQNTHKVYLLSSLSYMGVVVVPQNNYRSHSKDH